MDKNDLLLGKLSGLRDILSKYKPAELGKHPTRTFAEDYNKAREIALRDNSGMSVGGVAATYLEILTYSEQLIKLLSRLSIQKNRVPLG
jgi:hypothetical protein